MRSWQKGTGSMLVDTWLCTNCGTWEAFRVLQSHSMFHSPADSMQTRWEMLSLNFSVGKAHRCTSQGEICLPSLRKAKPVDIQYIKNSAWLFKLRSLTRIRWWCFFRRLWTALLMYHFVAITLMHWFSTPKVSVFSYNKSKSIVLFYSFSVGPVLNELVLKRTLFHWAKTKKKPILTVFIRNEISSKWGRSPAEVMSILQLDWRKGHFTYKNCHSFTIWTEKSHNILTIFVKPAKSQLHWFIPTNALSKSFI